MSKILKVSILFLTSLLLLGCVSMELATSKLTTEKEFSAVIEKAIFVFKKNGYTRILKNSFSTEKKTHSLTMRNPDSGERVYLELTPTSKTIYVYTSILTKTLSDAQFKADAFRAEIDEAL